MIPAAPRLHAGERHDEVEVKLDRIRGWLRARDLQAALIKSQAGFAWVTGGGRSHVSTGESCGIASALVTPADAFVITTNIEAARLAEEELGDAPLEVVDYRWHRPDEERQVVEKLCDPSRAVADRDGLGVPNAGAELAPLRYALLAPEIDRYHALGRASAQSVEHACRQASPDATEMEVAALVAEQCTRADILPLVNLVAGEGRVGRHRHPLPTSSRVGRHLLVALTGRRDGLHASLTRIVCFGEADADLRARHDAVVRVDATAIAASRPGTSLAEVFLEVVDEYAAQGFSGEWERHHQGGLTGYAGREIFATPDTGYEIRPSNVFAWNPSITRVKSEDTILVTEMGQEVLTRTGAWPEQEVAIGSRTISRPSLLSR